MSIAFHSYVRRLRLCSATSSRAWPRGPWRAGWGMCPRWEEQYKKHENHQGPSFTFYIYILLFFIFFFLQFCWSGSILTDCIFWMENLRRSHRRRFLGEGRAEEPQDDTAPMRPKTLDEAGLHNIFWRFQSCM